jgi:hypothetical protein
MQYAIGLFGLCERFTGGPLVSDFLGTVAVLVTRSLQAFTQPTSGFPSFS